MNSQLAECKQCYEDDVEDIKSKNNPMILFYENMLKEYSAEGEKHTDDEKKDDVPPPPPPPEEEEEEKDEEEPPAKRGKTVIGSVVASGNSVQINTF